MAGSCKVVILLKSAMQVNEFFRGLGCKRAMPSKKQRHKTGFLDTSSISIDLHQQGGEAVNDVLVRADQPRLAIGGGVAGEEGLSDHISHETESSGSGDQPASAGRQQMPATTLQQTTGTFRCTRCR
uniref:Uncharacterized protein n=1 Tax=Oryza nivara TaxID=4536 RepID=A0A0E0HEW2_ORYNI